MGKLFCRRAAEKEKVMLSIVVVVVAVAVLALFFGSMFGLYPYFQERGRQRRERRRLLEEFREAFGFEFFPGLPYMPVRIRLQFLASLLHEASEAQGLLFGLNDPLPSDVWSNIHQIVSDALDVRKAAFWHARNVAKWLGFEVLNKHTDYLLAHSIGAAILAAA